MFLVSFSWWFPPPSLTRRNRTDRWMDGLLDCGERISLAKQIMKITYSFRSELAILANQTITDLCWLTLTNLTRSKGISGLIVNQSVNGARFNQEKIRGVNLKITRFIWFSHHHRCERENENWLWIVSDQTVQNERQKGKGIQVSGTAIIFKIHTEIMGK